MGLGNLRVPGEAGQGALLQDTTTQPGVQVLAESQKGPQVTEPSPAPPDLSGLSIRVVNLLNAPRTWASLCKTQETQGQMRASGVPDNGQSALTSSHRSVITRELRGTREK